jgi:hypothetical protein
MAKHATKTNAVARQAQAGFLQGSIISTLLPGASIHSLAGSGTSRLTTHAMRLRHVGSAPPSGE